MSCLVAPFLGTYFFLHYQHNKIRKEVSEHILNEHNEENLVLLKFTAEESSALLKWKHAKEFEFNGRMFDIVSQENSNDTIYYTCYQDHKETTLNQTKKKLIAKSLGQEPFQKNHQKQIKNFFSTLFCKDYFAWSSNVNPSLNFEFLILNFEFSSIIIAPLSPPPKFLS